MATKQILITGDFVIDHHIYRGRGRPLKLELGGAALVHRMLTRVLPGGWTSHLAVDDPTTSQERVEALRLVQNADQFYAFWQPFPVAAPPEKQYWRASEAIGFAGSERGRGDVSWTRPQTSPPQIAVIADGGVHVAHASHLWDPKDFADAQWVVLNAVHPVVSGTTWNRLATSADTLVVVVSAGELRKSPIRLSQALSWEESIQDLLRVLSAGGGMEKLTRCRHLIVSFGTEGAAWFDLEGSKVTARTKVHLVYDAAVIEGDHGKAVEGDVYGTDSCLVAAVVRQLAIDPDAPDIASGLDRGLCAMRDLREKGHGPANEQADGFPAQRLARAAESRPYVYSHATFHVGQAQAAGWSLLRQSQRAVGPVYDLARLVLLRGPIGLANVPHISLGDYVTPDRHEIEAVRALIQLVRVYVAQKAASKPLSIGVFGPPGAGKSFVVRQMLNIVPKAKWLEFNLSQFNGPHELAGALHQIRDSVVEGQIPVAFFDEFDSQSYVWLKHLLAPMQDGRFQDGQLPHPIGKCVMVFAGGTSWTYETFGPPDADAATLEEPHSLRDFRLAKGPDFKSRLDGYLDVVGPNQRLVTVASGAGSKTAERFGGRWFDVDAGDIHFPVRRALMIRSELKCKVDEKLDIDEGLVHALLRTPRYTHGARSLGKVLQPLRAARPSPLRRSLLSPMTQLGLHVDAKAFMASCDAAPMRVPPWRDLPPNQLEVMARATHETYRELGRAQGWLKPALDKAFEDLDEFFQNSNRAAANRMGEILMLAGLRLELGRARPSEEEESAVSLEYSLEALAEAEHDGWMAWHFSQGWRYAPRRDDEKKLHNCLRPYRDLPKVETDKDRDAIRCYPRVAREGDMKIVYAS